VGFQQKVVERIFVHHVMKQLMPKCLSNLQDSINNKLIVESIKDGVSTHMARGHTTKHDVAKSFKALWQHLFGQVVERLPNTLGYLEGVF
jgi:hypothetical protein